jgi:uncharacterized membrane protein
MPPWGIPLAYAVAAVVGGFTLPRIENALLPTLAAPMNASDAIAIYASIGSGMIAFTGIVFSLAFIMLQFSATAYSPRLALWVTRDPVISHAIGIFTATFLYAISALAWIDRGGSGKVLFVNMLLAVGLLLTSVAMFVALIQRVSSLQINRILAFVGDHGRRVIYEMYPPFTTPIESVNLGRFAALPVTQTLVYAGRPQMLQAVNLRALLALATGCEGFVEVSSSVGDAMIEGRSIMSVFGGKQIVSERTWRKAFTVGDERTFEQDPKYALRLLVDIAIRALSPGINDPTTAVQALDQIEDLLRRLGRRRLEIGALRDDSGALRLVMQFPAWEDFLILAFEEIRSYGATNVQVMRRMKALVGDLISVLPRERREPLRHYDHRLDSTIARSFADSEERQEASIEDPQGLGAPRTHQTDL